jgi:hypothetical protein
MLHPRLLRRVHHGFGLVGHRNGVAGEDIHAIDAVQRRTEGARIVQVEQDCIAPFGQQPVPIRLLAYADADAGIARIAVELFQNQSAGLTGGAHEENKGAGFGGHLWPLD